VVGIDLIPTQPPRGVSTIQGNFLSPSIQAEVRAYVQDPSLGRPRRQVASAKDEGVTEGDLDELEKGYIDIERHAHLEGVEMETAGQVDSAKDDGQVEVPEAKLTLRERDAKHGRVVDVVLSDMSEPWDQITGFHKKSLSDPYFRLMNTSGIAFKDHAGSMVSANLLECVSYQSLTRMQDLCMAALTFSFDTLRTGGHFLCKFYQGPEDKSFETKLRRLFTKVHREKPDSSRSVRLLTWFCFSPPTDWSQESKEGYFVALRRKETPTSDEVFRE
jgi:21S rRNA (uridine2791-2'-O)-methyltransferase